jgi:hypothetical protein
MEGCQHNTMDVEYYGPNPQMELWYLGALRAAEEMAKYKVDRQAVKVKAGTFDADHYRYTDPKGSGTTESWVSQAVPGYVVKTIFTAAKDKETSTGELTQIESGVPSVLGSF